MDKEYTPNDPSKFFKSLIDDFKKENKDAYYIFLESPKEKDLGSSEEFKKYEYFIEKPMSFTLIREEITKGTIISVNDFLVKINLMFKNCRDYNVHTTPYNLTNYEDWNENLEINILIFICNKFEKEIHSIIKSKVENAINVESKRDERKKLKRRRGKINSRKRR